MQTIRVFVSSPSDVATERLTARDVIDRLQRHFHSRVKVEAAFWEDSSFEADATYQQQILRPSTFDIAVFILWSTVGRAPVTVDGVRHASGTLFEFHDAEQSRRKVGQPRLLLYRKTAQPPTDIRDTPARFLERQQQFQAVEAFFQQRVDPNQELLANRSFVTEGEFAEALEEDLRRKVEELLRDRDQHPRAADQPIASPYRGLMTYDEANESVFFGRTRALHQVMEALRRQLAARRPFMLIFGRSGVGKSSFVRAGLAPHITRTGRLVKVQQWRRALFEPSDSTVDLFRGLAAAMTDPSALPELAEAAGGLEALADLLRRNPATAAASVRKCLAELAPGTAGTDMPRLLLIIDPLEEAFTYRSNRSSDPDEDPAELARQQRAEQEGFAATLKELCASQAVLVLATLRHDFFEQCASLPGLRELIEGDGHHHLLPLSPTELAQAVRLPALAVGLTFEEVDGQRLDDRLVDDAMAHTEPLPLLSYTLDQLFERSGAAFTGVMTFKAFEQLGGLEGSIAKRAEEARAAARTRIPDGRRRIAWDGLFGRLVDIDPNGRRVRLYAPVASFTDADVAVVREELESARLLIVDKDDRGHAVTSIAHESMLRQWPFLRDWIEDRSEALRLRALLQTETAEWLGNGQPVDSLVRSGERLRRARELLDNPRGLQVPADVRSYVEACEHKANEAAMRARFRRRVRNAVAAFACLVLGTLGLVAQQLARDAERSANEAREAEASANKRLEDVVKLIDWLFSDLSEKLDTDNARDQELVAAIGGKIATHCQELQIDRDRADARRRLSNWMDQMAHRLAMLGGHQNAATVMRASLAAFDLSDPTDHRLEARRRNALGEFLWKGGNYTQSEQEYEAAQKILVAMDLTQTSEGAHTTLGLARALKPKGRYARAIEMTREGIETLESVAPAEHETLATSYNDLSDLLRNRGEYQAAEVASLAARRHATELVARVADLGNEQRKVAQKVMEMVRSDLAVLWHRWGANAMDTEKMRQAVTELSSCLDSHPDHNKERAVLLYKLARVQIDLGQLEGAATSLQSAHNILQAIAPEHPQMAKCKEARAELRLRQGQPQQALEDTLDVIRIRQDKLPDKAHPEIAAAFKLKSRCLLALNDPAGADAAAREADSLRRQFEDRERTDMQRPN